MIPKKYQEVKINVTLKEDRESALFEHINGLSDKRDSAEVLRRLATVGLLVSQGGLKNNNAGAETIYVKEPEVSSHSNVKSNAKDSAGTDQPNVNKLGDVDLTSF